MKVKHILPRRLARVQTDLAQRVQVLRVQPGDCLVFNSERALHNEQVARIKALALQAVPGVSSMVLHGGLELMGVLRGERT